MTKQSVIEEIRTALDQINQQYAVFTAGNRIPEDDELDMLKGKIIRLYDKINMLQLVEGSPVQPPVLHMPASGAELKQTFEPTEEVFEKEIINATVEPVITLEVKQDTIEPSPAEVISELKVETESDTVEKKVIPVVTEVQAARSGIFKESEPSIAQQFHESETIHDKIGAAQHAFAVADKLKLSPVADLVKAIGINEKFLFISQLFNNNQQVYQQAIEKLNNSKTFADAYMYFDTEVVTKFKADKTSDVYRQFIDILQRRFI